MAVIFIPMVHSDTTAKRIACEGLMNTYNGQTASVQQMRDYSDCVRLLHPVDHTGMRGIVAILLLAVIVGAAFGVYKRNTWYAGKFEGAFMGSILGLVGALITLVIIAGVGFVLGVR